MEKHILSKSTFLRAMQCTKSLYLYKHFIQLRDKPSPEQLAIFNRGTNVGILAQHLFEGGVDATANNRKDNIASVLKTKQLIENGQEVIYEACFQHAQTLAILDILVKRENKWYAYEVKSSVKISNTYVLDASLQYWVITNSGLELEDISLITMNNNYVRNGEIKIHELFATTSVKHKALANQKMIEENISNFKNIAVHPQTPNISIGEQCTSPYACDFMKHCWKDVPKNSVFEINAVPKAEQFALYNAGYIGIADVPEENNLDHNANIHIQSFKTNETTIDKLEIRKFISKINYPVSFLDFETFMPAVPLFNGTKPYQHIPFQYSLHIKNSKESEVEHLFFLAESGVDTRKPFIENLLNHCNTEGTILVYDALMERNVLNGLKKDFPQYSQSIDKILNRFVDLMIPFQQKLFYHHTMKNSFSIKNILHSLIPQLSYTDLKIASGNMAMTAFEGLQKETDMFKSLETREQLLAYCKLDTLAMVKVWEVLEKNS